MAIFLTLDYELFLGKRTGTPECCLVEPMEAFTRMIKSVGGNATIFVDAAYLFRLRELSSKNMCCQKDFSLVSRHIELLSKQGFDIQLHFHPQWCYSLRDDAEWSLDFEHYKLSDMEEHECFEKFAASKQLLDSVIGSQTRAFRAGGYCLHTMERFPELFIENGIKIDSSVERWGYVDSIYHSYDYRNPPEKSIYRFNSNPIKMEKDGAFLELSISSIRSSLYQYLKNKKTSSDGWGDGIGIGRPGNYFQRKVAFLSKAFKQIYLGASLDKFMVSALDYVFNKWNSCTLEEDFVTIGHPKNFSRESIEKVYDFLIKNKVKYSIKVSSDLLS